MSEFRERPLILNCHDHQLLGILHSPDPATRNSKAGVIVVVGGPQYRAGSHRQFTTMARALAAAGYPVLRFDYRGMGDSDGDFLGFERVGDDIAAAIDALTKAEPAVERVVLWGLCDAASACLMYGSRRDARVRGYVIANPWVRTTAGEATVYLKHYYLQRLLQPSFWRKVLSGQFNVVRSIKEFFGAVDRARAAPTDAPAQNYIESMLQGMRAASLPSLLLMSGKDLTAAEFAQLCTTDARWKSAIAELRIVRHDLPNSDHTFSARDSKSAVNARSIVFLEQLEQR